MEEYIRMNNLDEVKLFIASGGDVNRTVYGWRDSTGKIIYGQFERFRICLYADEEVSMVSLGDSHTVTTLAARYRRVDILKLCLENGGDVNLTCIGGYTATSIAIKYGYLDILKLCIQAGGDVNKEDWNGRPPMILAARYGHFDVFKLCVEAGGDVNKKWLRARGVTPTIAAGQRGFIDILMLCIAHGGKSKFIKILYILHGLKGKWIPEFLREAILYM